MTPWRRHPDIEELLARSHRLRDELLATAERLDAFVEALNADTSEQDRTTTTTTTTTTTNRERDEEGQS